jgi:diaminopropionate ammonia-lyase
VATWTIRPVGEGDAAAMAEVFRRASLANDGDRAALLAHPEVLELEADALAGSTVAADGTDGTVIGFIRLVYGDGTAELEDLFVDPDWMRRGVATALVRHEADAARRAGITRVDLTANPHALAFYERVGFVRDGDEPTRFGTGTRMHLDIDRSVAPQIFANPAKRRGTGPAPIPIEAPRAFHRRLPGYVPTPLVAAPAAAVGLGVADLHVKVEANRFGLPAFKMLGASWATYRALVDRLGAEPAWDDLAGLRAAVAPLGALTLVAATDGNHGRAVARMARWLGYGAHIFVPAGTVAARVDGIASEGARVTVVDGTYDDAVATSAALASDDVLVISDTSWEGYTEIPASVIDGYSTIFAEVDEQLPGAPEVVCVQLGVGALAAAAATRYGDHAAIVAVEPHHAACGLRSAEAGHPVTVPGPHDSIMAGLNCGTLSVVAWPAISTGVDVFVAIDDGASERAMRDLASVGIEAGETGAAGLAGLQELAAADVDAVSLAGRSVLVICTEGPTDPVAYERIVGRRPTGN